MASTYYVSGASDDLCEIMGDLREEFDVPFDTGRLVLDVTGKRCKFRVLVAYQNPGVWAVAPFHWDENEHALPAPVHFSFETPLLVNGAAAYSTVLKIESSHELIFTPGVAP